MISLEYTWESVLKKKKNNLTVRHSQFKKKSPLHHLNFISASGPNLNIYQAPELHQFPAEDPVSVFNGIYLLSCSICGDHFQYVVPGDTEITCTRHSQHLGKKEKQIKKWKQMQTAWDTHTSNLESSAEEDFTASTLPFIASVNQGSLPRVRDPWPCPTMNRILTLTGEQGIHDLCSCKWSLKLLPYRSLTFRKKFPHSWVFTHTHSCM